MEGLQALRELQQEIPSAQAFLVGGAVRDLIRGIASNDIDVMVRGVPPKEFEEWMSRKGTIQSVGKSFGVYLFKPTGAKKPIEVAFPRIEITTGDGHREFEVRSDYRLSVEEDSNRRDFTLNALYLPVDKISEGDLEFDPADILDFHGGREHIRRGLIVAVGNPADRIKEDPLRMLRAMVLVARTGYRLEGRTFGAIRRHASSLSTVAKERVRDEFIKIMEAGKPSPAFKAMHRSGLLAEVMPELEGNMDCGQNPRYHSYPVFEHLIYATDAACKITDRLDVRFGALCHDLGKASTRALRPGGSGPDDVSFHNHELASTKLTYKFMRDLKFPKEFTEKVVHLVRHHQYKYDRDWTDRAVRRHIKKWGIVRADLEDLNLHPQFLLRQADRMGNALKAHLPITPKQVDFQARIVEIYNSSSAHSLRDLAVNGHDLMEAFDLKPSPLIKEILAYLFDAVEGDPTLNKQPMLLALAKRYIEGHADGDNQTNEQSAGSSS